MGKEIQHARLTGRSKGSSQRGCACTLSRVRLLVTLWTAACQASLSVGFPRQEYWSGLLFPSLGDVPKPGIEPVSPVCPALAGRFSTTAPSETLIKGEAQSSKRPPSRNKKKSEKHSFIPQGTRKRTEKLNPELLEGRK